MYDKMFLSKHTSEITSMADIITTTTNMYYTLICKEGTVSLLGKVEEKD